MRIDGNYAPVDHMKEFGYEASFTEPVGMNKNPMSYVRTLSMDDTKTRTQKLTHGISEVGEMAQA